MRDEGPCRDWSMDLPDLRRRCPTAGDVQKWRGLGKTVFKEIAECFHKALKRSVNPSEMVPSPCDISIFVICDGRMLLDILPS